MPTNSSRPKPQGLRFADSKKMSFGPDDLTGKVMKADKYYFANGVVSDVWRGEMSKGGTKQIVAVKVIRSVWKAEYLERLNSKLLREAQLWSQLDHTNITPFYGISFDMGVPLAPCLVSPYYENGHIATYLQKHPDSDRMAMICQVASGLAYLHKQDIIHGDIKSSNILVNDEHVASISDFGLSRVLETTGFTTKAVGGTCRWMAQELLDPPEEDDEGDTPLVTTASDVWAFAMTVLEILSGKLPFHWMKYDTAVILHVVKGGRPKHDAYPMISKAVWQMLERCWLPDPAHRPSMESLSVFFDFVRAGRPKIMPITTAQEPDGLYFQPWGSPKSASRPSHYG